MSNQQGRRKQEQTVPLIFERVRSRVTREVSMPAKIAHDLARYMEWACQAVGADRGEAMTLIMEQALGQFFQRDRLFQEVVKARPEVNKVGEAARPASPGKPAPSSPPAGSSAASTVVASAAGASAPTVSGRGVAPAQPPSTRRD